MNLEEELIQLFERQKRLTPALRITTGAFNALVAFIKERELKAIAKALRARIAKNNPRKN